MDPGPGTRDQGPGTRDQGTKGPREGPRTNLGYHLPVSPVAAVIFDFDGVVFDSETPEYESHRRIYERCGVTLTVDEWCGVIGTWSENHDEQWFKRLAAQAAGA